MTRDNIDDFVQFLKDENKFFVISIFDEKINGMNVITNLNEMPNLNVDFTYPNGKIRSKIDTILEGIEFSLKN